MPEKQESPAPERARLGFRVTLTKRELVQLLQHYESEVKSQAQIRPFIDRYFERQRHLNEGVK